MCKVVINKWHGEPEILEYNPHETHAFEVLNLWYARPETTIFTIRNIEFRDG